MKCITDGCEEPKYECMKNGKLAYRSMCKGHYAAYHTEWQKKNRIARNVIVQRYRDKKRAAGLPFK